MINKNWQDAKRILCIRLDAIGDVLMTSPALDALKTSGQDRHITLLTSPAGSAIGRMIPAVDRIISFESIWMKHCLERSNPNPEFALIDTLRSGNFDAAVIFTVYSQSALPAALLCHLARIPLRLAYCRENPYQLLTDWVKETEPHDQIRHEVERQLDLVGHVQAFTADPRMKLDIPTDAAQRMKSFLLQNGLSKEKAWAVIHPGSTAPSRRWQLEGYAAVADKLISDYGWQVIFTGQGTDEEHLVDTVRSEMKNTAHSLANKLSLAELVALLSEAPMLIAGNTGPVHIAAAVGTPVVDIYALTNPQHTPWSVPHRVLNYDVPCKNCYKSICPESHNNCIRLVAPSEVIRAALELREEVGARVCLSLA